MLLTPTNPAFISASQLINGLNAKNGSVNVAEIKILKVFPLARATGLLPAAAPAAVLYSIIIASNLKAPRGSNDSS